MQRLIILGDAGVRKGGRIELDGEEYTVFQVNRNGEWHGPDEVQLWCIIGDDDELEDYEHRNYIPHWLDVITLDASDVTVTKKAGPLAV